MKPEEKFCLHYRRRDESLIVRCQPSITHQHSPEDLREDLKDTALDGRDPNHRETVKMRVNSLKKMYTIR